MTTHLGFPVWAPTIHYLIQNRDTTKYPLGMTPQEVGEELLKQSERRLELLPGEKMAPENWKDLVRSQWSRFIRGLYSMMKKSASVSHSPDLVVVDRGEGAEKGPLRYTVPEGRPKPGTKFGERKFEPPRWIKDPGKDPEKPSSVQPPGDPDLPPPEGPKGSLEKGRIEDILKSMFG